MMVRSEVRIAKPAFGRRGLLAGFGLLLAAPAIIRTPGLLMPIKPQRLMVGFHPRVFVLDDLDLDRDSSLDYRFLLPLTKIELYAGSFSAPWAEANLVDVA